MILCIYISSTFSGACQNSKCYPSNYTFVWGCEWTTAGKTSTAAGWHRLQQRRHFLGRCLGSVLFDVHASGRLSRYRNINCMFYLIVVCNWAFMNFTIPKHRILGGIYQWTYASFLACRSSKLFRKPPFVQKIVTYRVFKLLWPLKRKRKWGLAGGTLPPVAHTFTVMLESKLWQKSMPAHSRFIMCPL